MRPQAWWTPIGLFAVIGPSRKLQRGPPAFCARRRANVRRSAHCRSRSCSWATRSGLLETGANIGPRRGRGPRPGQGSRAGLLVYRLTVPARRPPVFETRRIIPRDVDTAATPACAAHAICVRRRVPVAPLSGPRPCVCRRLDARPRVGRGAPALAGAARRHRPARRPHRAPGLRRPAVRPDRAAPRQHRDPRLPHRRRDRRLERRALPQQRRRLGHGSRRSGRSCRSARSRSPGCSPSSS